MDWPQVFEFLARCLVDIWPQFSFTLPYAVVKIYFTPAPRNRLAYRAECEQHGQD